MILSEPMQKVKIGIIICYRYKNCAGGKCFRSAANREGAFSLYKGMDIEIAGFTTCGGCPGGNIEYFEKFITDRYGMKVIYGTHPVPQNYYITHTKLNTWNSKFLQESVKPVLADEITRLSYD